MKLYKTTERHYNDMLEVVPPVAMDSQNELHGFLVGEPMNHNKQGEAQYTSYFSINDTYVVGGPMTVAEFARVIADVDTIDAVIDADEPVNEQVANELEAIEEHGMDIVQAFVNCYSWEDVTAEAISEAYAGKYDSGEDFAQEIADQLGLIDENVQWPYSCIDWERAAHELMYDYCEDSGHYFRNI